MSSNALAHRPRNFVGRPLVLVLVLFGLLGGPCAMAIPGSSPPEAVAGMHDNCPNAGGDREMHDEDCCCLISVAGHSADIQPKSSAMWVTLPPAPLQLAMPRDLPVSTAILLRACLHETSPPVYLATLRLRI
jgi:hypothetical protein